MALPVHELGKKHSFQGILGPMRSGKSTDLLARLDYYEKVFGKRVCLVRCAGMHRDGIDAPGVSSSRTKIYRRACFDVEHASEITDTSYDVYAFEEAQFIPGLPDVASRLFFQHEKIVLVACLNGDYLQRPFTTDRTCDLSRLIAIFSHVTFTTSTCSVCRAEASYSGLRDPKQRLEGGKMPGDEAYTTYCSECVFKYRKKAAT